PGRTGGKNWVRTAAWAARPMVDWRWPILPRVGGRAAMKKLLVGFTGVLLLAAAVWPQSPAFKVHTCPNLPTRDALDRLSLTMAWKNRLAVKGERDGLFSVQLIPGGERPAPQLVVQTFRGDVVMLDAETGDVLWRTPVGDPFPILQPVGYNAYS